MRRGLDQGVVATFIFAPPVAAVLWLLFLSGRFDDVAAAVLWVLFLLALRPLVWHWAASRDRLSPERATAYRERERHSVNTAFAAAVLVGLAAFDVLRLPGAPYWTDQPRASFALVPVLAYLLWLALHADIPAEVSAGYRRLFGAKEGP